MRRWYAAGAALFLSSCPISHQGIRLAPLVQRPDTRTFEGVLVDSSVFDPLLALYRARLPHEAAACLYGRVEINRLRITRVVLAQYDSADDYHVYFNIRTGCELSDPDGARLLGVSHDHTHTHEMPRPFCTHSDMDAFVLFQDTRALFSLLVCSNGWLEVLWQDGRRFNKWWAVAN